MTEKQQKSKTAPKREQLTKESIENFLKNSQRRSHILTPQMQETVLTMIDTGESMDGVMEHLKTQNPKVKRQHVKNFLNRYLKDSN